MDLKGYCEMCVEPGRDKCTKLCAVAEGYANQDQVNLRELTVGLRVHSMHPDFDSVWELVHKKRKTKEDWAELIGFLSRVMKLSNREIAKLIGVPRQTVDRWMAHIV